MKAKLKKFILEALLACDGVPMPETALVAHLQNASRPHRASVIECEVAMKELEIEHWIAGLHDDLTQEKSFTLTEKGKHKAVQL
jgi:hypothetical protein